MQQSNISSFFGRKRQRSISHSICGDDEGIESNEELPSRTPSPILEDQETIASDSGGSLAAANSKSASKNVRLLSVVGSSTATSRLRIEEVKSHGKKAYGFNNKWLKEFKWLRLISETKKAVYCTICQNEKVQSPWATEKIFPTWRIDALRHHDTKDRFHLRAVDAIIGRKLESIKVAATVSKEIAGREVIAVMRKVLFLIQNDLPLNLSTKLHKAITFFGEQVSAPNILPRSHDSNYSTYQFLRAINDDILTCQLNQLRNSLCFNLHIDESTDVSDENHLILYITSWNSEIEETESKFLCLLPIETANAESLLDMIETFFSENHIDIKKMVSFTSDGASVMLGVKNGVAQRIRRQYVPHLIDIHCIAHREALAVKDVLKEKECEHFWSVEQKTKELIAFISVQTARKEIEKLAKILETTYIVPQRIFEIRWLSRCQVIKTMVKMIVPILTYLQSKDTSIFPQLKGLKKRIANFTYILSLFHMLDILEPLNKLNLCFQNNVVHPFEVPTLVEQHLSILEDRYMGENFFCGPAATELLNSLFRPDRNEKSKFQDLRSLELIKLNTITEETCCNVETHVKDLVKKISHRIRCRLMSKNPILELFAIFVPKAQIINFDESERIQYGQKEIQELSKIYGETFIIDENEAQEEWQVFKRISIFQAAKSSNPEKHWTETCKLCAVKSDLYPNLSKFCRILVSLNAQNAVVERGFSVAHRIKTKLRSRIKVSILDKLMRIKLNSMPYETANLANAFQNWLDMSENRGRYNIGMPVKKQACDKNVCSQTVDSENDEDVIFQVLI